MAADQPFQSPAWSPNENVFDDPNKFGYGVFSTRFDITINAAELIKRRGSEKRLNLLDHISEMSVPVANSLTKAMRDSTLDESFIVSILIDHSGSMNRPVGTGPDHPSPRGAVVDKGSGAALAARISITIATALEKLGAKSEILGFTTVAWVGGQSRDAWRKAGRPQYPGRLNDLLHIIYKAADEPSAPDVIDRLEAALCPSILKENIDGEAIAWARSRLLARPETKKVLIFISDGAPVDDSTLNENGPNFLERHLLHVIEDINKRQEIRLIGVGIGYDISRYISPSVRIGDSKASFEDQLPSVVKLITDTEIES